MSTEMEHAIPAPNSVDNLCDGSWIAVQVQSKTEKAVNASLQYRGYESFLPTYRQTRRWSDRQVVLDAPLFPGYLFCRWKRDPPHRIVDVPGVIRLVGNTRKPIPVDDVELESVRRIVESGIRSMPWKLARVGDRVKLASGPLTGIDGTLIRVGRNRYFVVQVSLMQRAVAVTIPSEDVAAAD